MKKYTCILVVAGLFAVSHIASAAFVTPDISNGGFESGGTDWRVYGAGMSTGVGDPYEGTSSLNFDASSWAGGDYGLDRWGTMIPVSGTDSLELSFAAKNNDGLLDGNRIGVHLVEFKGTQASPTNTALDEVHHFDSGAPGTWSRFTIPYSVRDPETTMLNIAFKYYNHADLGSVVAGNYNIDAVKTTPQITITPTHIGGVEIGGVEGFNHDLFDGTVTVTDHSPLHPLTDPVGTDNWFISPNAETPEHSPPGLLVFADTNTPNFIEFHTDDEVTLGSMVFYLGGDHNPGVGYEGRSLSNIVISAGTASNALVEVADIAVDPDYDTAYGLPSIKVLVEFSPLTAKYFRLDIEQPDIYAADPTWDWNGPRIREIDAYGTNVVTTASFTQINVTTGSVEGVTGDDFEGVSIDDYSTLHGISPGPDDWFISPNTTELLFDDNAGTKFIEFHAPETLSVSNIVVSISADYVDPGLEGRAISGIRVLCGVTPGAATSNVISFITIDGDYSSVYGSNWLEVDIGLDPVLAIGRYFRIELDQFGSGARIREIDGYGAVYLEDIVEPVILSWTQSSPGVMRMVVDAQSAANRYRPEATADLVVPSWANVAHSTNGLAPFVETNLSYSTAEGANEVIYVQATNSAAFFRIFGE